MTAPARHEMGGAATELRRLHQAIYKGILETNRMISDLETMLLSDLRIATSPGLQVADRIQQRLTDLQTIAYALASASSEELCSGSFQHLTDDVLLNEIRILLIEPVEASMAEKPEKPGTPILF